MGSNTVIVEPAECALLIVLLRFAEGLIYRLSFIWQNAKFPLRENLQDGAQGALLGLMYKDCLFLLCKNRRFSPDKLCL